MAPPIVLPQPPSPHFYDETPQEYDMNKSSIVSCSLFVRSFFADELTGISTWKGGGSTISRIHVYLSLLFLDQAAQKILKLREAEQDDVEWISWFILHMQSMLVPNSTGACHACKSWHSPQCCFRRRREKIFSENKALDFLSNKWSCSGCYLGFKVSCNFAG